MNTFQVPANLVERLGWVLVHSVWQFALIALVALLLARSTRRFSAATRYWTLLLGLAVMVASPVVTLVVMPADESVAAAVSAVDQNGVAMNAERMESDGDAPDGAGALPEPVENTGPLANVDASELPTKTTLAVSWRAAVDRAVRPWLSVIVGIWCLGVLAFAWRPLLSWHTVRRLRHVGVSPVPDDVAAMLRRTAERLRVRQAVQILQSTLTRVPVVIGYLRPVILLPVSVIVGVPTSQLEAILAHELAHVRRHDFLVNLLQTLVETVFFYHPAVWWLSHRIRVERENCCDDLAVAAIGNRVEYGRALLALEELRGAATALALGARSGSLLDRVQRLFRRDPGERSVGAVGIVGLGLLALVIIAVGVWNSTLAEKPRSPADEQPARMTADELAAWSALEAMSITVHGPAANRWTLQQQIQNMERTKFPEKAIRDLREQLEQPVRAVDFWNVPADAWTHIGRLTSLEELRFVASDLRGQPMDEIGRLTNLRKLNVTNSKCNPQDLAPLRGLADLESLEVMCTVFEESEAWRQEQLGELTAEEQAVVARCLAVGPNRESMAEAAILTDRVLANFGGLNRLRTLRLWNTYVSGRGLESLKTLPAIEELDLTLIEFTPETARVVGGLRTLKRFRYALVTDETLAELASLSELEDLEVWAGGVTDRGVDHLLKLAKLRKLAIRGSQLSDAGLQRLASLPHLESLDLSFSGSPTTYGGKPIQEPLTAAGVKRFRDQKPGCKVTFEQKRRGAEPAEVATDATQPVPADEAVEPKRVTFVIAQHVILHDRRIVTWEEVAKILDDAAKAGKAYPQFYSTNGGLPREEELREHRSRLYKQLYDAGKIDGMSVGSLSPRIGEYLDRIKTPADLVPDESQKQAGRVLDVGGKPLADVEVFPLPAEHVNGVYLRDGRNRNPLEERLARSDRDGNVVIFPEPGDALVAAVHPNGFAITTLAEFKEQMGRLQLKPWARVTGQRPVEGDDAKQNVDFTCYPVPGLSFHIYETEIAKDGSFDQKFVPPGKVIVSRSISTGQGASMSFPVETIDLSPGQSHKVTLGPIPDDAKAQMIDLESLKREAEPKPGENAIDQTQTKPADEGVAKHPPLEFRIATSKADRDADGVAWFPIKIIEPRKPVPAGESGANLPFEIEVDVKKWRGLLWDKPEHALLADGTWRVVKCDVVQSAQSTDLAPNFEIRITVDAAGGAALRRMTSTHLNQALAIVVDGTIVAAPVLRSEFGEEFVITGTFSKAAAEKIAAVIRKPDERKPIPQSKLDGVWIAEKVTTAGEIVPKEKFPFELHFEKDKLIFRYVAPSLGKDRVHEIVVDETTTPATIDITREIRGKKETVYGIYKLEGDRLWICSLRDSNQQPSKERPTTFDSSNEVRSDLLVLTRKPVPTK